MGFFETFWSWLEAQLAAYIGANTALVAAALEPAIVTLAIVYVMVWGFLGGWGRAERAVNAPPAVSAGLLRSYSCERPRKMVV